jgi:gas vesicle protein
MAQMNPGRNLDLDKEDNMMKPGTENETASNSHETVGRCKESLRSLTRMDQVNQRNWSGKFTTFAVGLGIGAVVGLLFAPASGKKTRHYIARTAKQGLADATSTGKRWSRRAQETVEDVKANVAGVVKAGQKAYRTAREA